MKTVRLADRILEIVKEFIPTAEQSYNKYYMGFWVDGKACNFAICRPQKNGLRLEIGLPESEEYNEIISSSELDILDYDKRWGKYRIKLNDEEITNKKDTIKNLLIKAYELRK